MKTDTLVRQSLNLRLEEDEESRLVAVARTDPAAFSALYRRYVTPVYRYLYKWTGSQAEAEDLTSQVFTAALEGLGRYREQGTESSGGFSAWLFTIARRKAIAAYRRSNREAPLETAEGLPEHAPGLLEQAVRGEQRRRLSELLSSLDAEQRDLLHLRFTAGLGYAEIGTLLGRSEGAIKMAVHRLLQDLSAQWEK